MVAERSPQYPTEFSISAYGVKVGVRTTQQGDLAKLEPYLPVNWRPTSHTPVDRTYSLKMGGDAGASTPVHHLYRDGRKLLSSTEEQVVLDAFESHLALHVAEMAHDRVFVHAGVVGWQGQAIVIPGRSFTGKTTLVAALVRAGAVYYSDEYAIFDQQGCVHPYPRALHIRKSGESRQTKCPAETLGASVGKKPLPVGLILASRYRTGARFRPKQISAGLGMLELLKNTVSARRAPEAALNTFQPAVLRAQILRGCRGDAAVAADQLLTKLALDESRSSSLIR